VVKEWREVLNEYEKKDGLHRIMMVEINETIAKTVEYYSVGADIPFNFELFKIDPKSSVKDIHELIKNWLNGVPESKWPNWIIGNHDQPRIANRTSGELIDAYNMINLLLKGTPLTYYGEELGMVDTFITWEQTKDPSGRWYGPERYSKFSRDPERTPMQWNAKSQAGFTTGEPWLPVNPNYKTINVQREKREPRSHLSTYLRLQELRRLPAGQNAQVEYPVTTENIFSFSRACPETDDAFVVLINFGKEKESVDLTGASGNDIWVKSYQFPQVGLVKANSINIPDSSPLAKIGGTVQLQNVELGPNQAVVIKFQPKWKK